MRNIQAPSFFPRCRSLDIQDPKKELEESCCKMTSVLTDQQKNVVRIMKQKPQNQKAPEDTGREESRSFLNFSRENLSISNSDIEQGFNKTRFRVRKHTLISIAALVLALACVGIEIWKLKWVVENAKEIEILKRDVDTLKHRLLEEDLLDELKAFEQKLYAEEGNGDDEDPDMENVDYDSNYDDKSHDYTDDYQASGLATRSSDLPHASESTNSSDKDLEEILVALRKTEVRSLFQVLARSQDTQDLEKCLREKLDNVKKEKRLQEEKEDKEEMTTKSNLSDFKIVSEVKQKRSVFHIDKYQNDSESMHEIPSDLLPNNELNKSRKRKHRQNQDSTKLQKKRSDTKVENEPTGPDVFQRSDVQRQASSEKVFRKNKVTSNHHDSDFQHVKKESPGMKMNFGRFKQDNVKTRKLNEKLEAMPLGQGRTTRHLKFPRQMFAVHYGGDSSLFSNDDEHTGNGRAKHSGGIFKAWKPSDWVADLGMSKHFSLSHDGKLTVKEPGLYLAYAQIHYLDEHDENGFHMLVNDRPILQCMVYSPGIEHKSRSCFSAQITVLQSGDNVILKDVDSARYTLFQKDKSFFGLAKLGDWRQPQKHQQHATQP